MSYDLDHETIFHEVHEPVVIEGVVAIGRTEITVSRVVGDEDFHILVSVDADDLDPKRCEIVRVTPKMLAAMNAVSLPSNP